MSGLIYFCWHCAKETEFFLQPVSSARVCGICKFMKGTHPKPVELADGFEFKKEVEPINNKELSKIIGCPGHMVNLYEEQPDVGGNRHYDYISVEAYEAAIKTLDKKERWDDLTTNEIVVLRGKLKGIGIDPDVADHKGRLALIRCIISHCENRDEWLEKARKLEKQLSEARGGR